MPQSESISILIISEQAESVKLITISLRGFFPGCHVDVAYSADEARAWTQPNIWALVLIDEQGLAGGQPSLYSELKSRSPDAGTILLSDRTESASAIQALQTDVDFFLSKQSPAFLTELLFCAREAIEKYHLRKTLDHAQQRHHRLIDSLSDTAYELDANGCFLMVGPGISTLLGYSPDELVGLPYTTLIPPGQGPVARHHFNERRSDARSKSRVELTLLKKPVQDNKPLTLVAEISARGLYDSLHRFVGTVGLIRDLSELKDKDTTIHQLRREIQQTEALLAQTKRVTSLSQQLHDPLTSLLAQSQQLLTTIRDTHLDDRVETLISHAAEARKLGTELAQAILDGSNVALGHSINDILDDALMPTTPASMDTAGIIRQFSPHLPSLLGDRERITKLVRHLLSYAQSYLRAVGRAHQLIVSTRTVGPSAISAGAPSLFPLAPPTEVEVELYESDKAWLPVSEATPSPSTDLIESYQLVRQLDGVLDVLAPMQGPLRMVLRLPLLSDLSPEPLPSSITSSTVSPASVPDSSPIIVTDVSTTDSGRPQKERRHSPRTPTTLPATITVGPSTWTGTISNISLGGACITLPGDFPTVPSQDAFLVLRTAVAILELHGTTQERALWPSPGTPTSELVVIFERPEREEAAVLASLIQAAKERTSPFSLEVLLSSGQQLDWTAGTPLARSEPEQFDRRESVRVAVSIPVRLDVMDPTGRPHRLAALTVNVSRGGTCLHLNAKPEILRGVATLHFSPTQTQSQPGSHEPSVPESPLPVQFIWLTQDPGTPNEFRHQDSAPSVLVGLRFQALTPYAEREVGRLVRQHLSFPGESRAPSQQALVVSIPRECRNSRSQTIMVTDDHLHQPLAPNTPVVIIAPGYGQTALDAISLSYFLAYQQLRVLRYDHTNHVGLSDGELQQTTLRSMQADLLKVVEFVQHTWPTAPLIVIASDVTARVALKMAVQSRPLDLLLLINPVVDIQAMLMTVHGHDLVADHRYGLRRGIVNLLGLNVDVDRFVGDIVAGHFTDLASTIADVRLLRSPTGIVTTPNSPLGPLPSADLPQAFLTALGTRTRLITVPSPLIGQDLPLNESYPQAFQQVLEQIAATVTVPTVTTDIHTQTQYLIPRQQRIELECTRLRHHLSQITRDALRIAHLQQLSQLGNLHEHWHLLDNLYRLLSPLEPGSILVDVGVGQGDFVRAAMINQAYRSRQTGRSQQQPVRMVGLEHSQDLLIEARQNFRALLRELNSDFAGTLTTEPPLGANWIHTDWMQGLPIKDCSIHRIVCNLSLPFAISPVATIRELYRVLHSQGRLVLTVFHQNSDLSVLYRRHLHRATQDEFSPQAQVVLQYLGRLREAIRHGLLHTFDRSSLIWFLRQAGIFMPRILPVLDGHALLAIIEKEKSSG